MDPETEQLLPGRRGGGGSATQASTPGGGTDSSWDFGRVVVALGVVLLLIFVVQRAWKRLGMPGSATRSAGVLQVISKMNLSPRQQVLLLRVGRRCVLVASNGTQMNPLCEISDPEEVAALLGQEAAGRMESVTSSFNSVLGTAEREFEEPSSATAEAPETPGKETPAPAGADPELSSAQQELAGLMERVRNLSKQFSRS